MQEALAEAQRRLEETQLTQGKMVAAISAVSAYRRSTRYVIPVFMYVCVRVFMCESKQRYAQCLHVDDPQGDVCACNDICSMRSTQYVIPVCLCVCVCLLSVCIRNDVCSVCIHAINKVCDSSVFMRARACVSIDVRSGCM